MKCIFLCFRLKVSFLFFRLTPRLVFISSFTYFFRSTFPLDTFRNYPSVIRKIFAMYFVANHAFRETRSFFTLLRFGESRKVTPEQHAKGNANVKQNMINQ